MKEKNTKGKCHNEEVAINEFERWAEMMDLDIDEKFMDEEELSSFRKLKRRLVGAIMRGALVIDADTGEAVFSPIKTELEHPLRFHEIDGAAMMEMDKKRKNEDVHKMYAVIAAMCKVQIKVISSLKGIDLKICQALSTLLMD